MSRNSLQASPDMTFMLLLRYLANFGALAHQKPLFCSGLQEITVTSSTWKSFDYGSLFDIS